MNTLIQLSGNCLNEAIKILKENPLSEGATPADVARHQTIVDEAQVWSTVGNGLANLALASNAYRETPEAIAAMFDRLVKEGQD